MKTKILFSCLFLFLITYPAKAQEWQFVGLDSLEIKQLNIYGDTIWAGTVSKINTNIASGLYRSINNGTTWIRTDT